MKNLKNNRISIMFLTIGFSLLYGYHGYHYQPTKQELPVSKILIIGDQRISLEVAKTAQELAIGLMGRDSLPTNHGMLLEIDSKPGAIWMKGMEIPLDIVYLDHGEVVTILRNVPTCLEVECRQLSRPPIFNAVLELSVGAARNMKVGDILDIQNIK